MEQQPTRERESDRIYRREVRRQIILPIGLGFLFTAGLVALVLLLPLRGQVSIVSDVMLTWVVLCPLAICMFLPALLMALTIYGMGSLNRAAAKPLHRLHDFSETTANKAAAATDEVNQRTLRASARLGWLYRATGVFDRPEPAQSQEKDVT